MSRRRAATSLSLALLALPLAVSSCRREPPPPPPEPDPLEAIPQRQPAVRVALGAPALATRAVFAAVPGTTPARDGGALPRDGGAPAARDEVVVVGLGGRFHAVDAARGTLRWQHTAAPSLFRPMVDGARLLLPSVDGKGPLVADVDAATGRARHEVRLARLPHDAPGGMSVAFNTPPSLAGGRVLWPSSTSLYAFSLGDGAQAWRYDGEGPTPYRRFQFGSEPALVEDGVAYWAHQRGLAAVDVGTGKARWTWGGYRGFALRPVLSRDHVFVTSDKEVLALDRASGAVRWFFGPDNLRFEHLASEDMAGYSNGVYWFVGEPLPFHYWLLFLDAKTGKGRASAELFGRGLTGSVATDGVRLYARLGAWLVAYRLSTAKPLWRVSLGGHENGSSPTVGAGRVWIVDAGGHLVGCALAD